MLLRKHPRSGTPVDPVALLKREHKMIRDQLDMIETLIGPRRGRMRAAGGRARSQPDLGTLRELFQFFTGRDWVHFAREKVLITALSRTLGRRRKERKPLENILHEHHTLRSEAAGIFKRLGRKTASAPQDTVDVSEIRSFVRHYREQIACEEHILYVLAELRLSPEERQRVSSRMLEV